MERPDRQDPCRGKFRHGGDCGVDCVAGCAGVPYGVGVTEKIAVTDAEASFT